MLRLKRGFMLQQYGGQPYKLAFERSARGFYVGAGRSIFTFQYGVCRYDNAK